MRINGKDITVKALLEKNLIRWSASSLEEIHANSLVQIQAMAGYNIRDYGIGEMKFSNDGKQCTWTCFSTKEDYNDCFPSNV